jgi:hypothetical protein
MNSLIIHDVTKFAYGLEFDLLNVELLDFGQHWQLHALLIMPFESPPG